MQCPRCQHQNPTEATFCGACGTPLESLCLACDASNPPTNKFCHKCGGLLTTARPEARFVSPGTYTPKHLAEKILTSKSALEGERKQVTVLFADVVGFSTLAERLDPEAIHTIMDGCFELLTRAVHRYEGTVNQFTGDGIMALFGAPITHEDHAVRALEAALSIQADVEGYGETVQRGWGVPFQMRVGINTGLVVVARIGDNLRMDYTAQGDTTNLAARLQQLAPPGAVWVGEATHHVASGAFEWRLVGPLTVKGRAGPVRAYELLGRRAVRSRFEVQAQRGLTGFVGRDAEFQHLLATWEKAKQGQGQVVSVVGEAGLGKSRLLYEFKQRLAREAIPYLEGSCFAYGEAISYLPFLEIVKALFGLEGLAGEADAKRQIAQRLAAMNLDRTTVEPYLNNLLGFTVDDAVFPKLPPHLVRERTVTALRTLMLATAVRHRVVLIVEDVHWIDKATEEVLGALVEAIPTVPLLLVLVYRPEYLHAWATKAYHAQITLTRLPGASGAEMVRAILQKPYASSIPLERLSPEQSTALVQELLETASIPVELEQLIAARTDGNPFFIEELTRSLLESGDLLRQNGGYVFQQPVATLRLPTTVQGVLLARIDRLNAQLKSVLQVASVIGRVFSYPVLADVVERRDDLDRMLQQLEDLEFIYPTSLAPQREYSFKHVLTQQAVYDALLRPKREALHEGIARALEALYPDRLEEYYELLAYHYSRSENSDKAVDYLDLANQKAVKANAMEEAKAYFDQAMQLLDALPDTQANRRRRCSLLVNQVMVFFLLFKYPDYHALLTRYEPIAVELGDPRLLGAFYTRIGWHEALSGQFDQALSTHARAAELSEAAGSPDDACHAYLMSQWMHSYKGDFDLVFPLQEHVARTLKQHFNLRWYGYSVAALTWTYRWLGRWDDAVREGLEALRVVEEFGDKSQISFAALSLSMAYTDKGELDQGIHYGQLAVEKAPTPVDRAYSQAVLGWAWCRAGETRRGIELCEEGVSLIRRAQLVGGEPFTPFLGEGYWRAGEYDKACEALRHTLDIAERCGLRFNIGCAHRLLAEVALSSNPDQLVEPLARPDFEQSIEILRETGAENELALAYAGYGRLHKAQGRFAEARDYLTRGLEIFDRLGTLIEPDKVRAELAGLPQ